MSRSDFCDENVMRQAAALEPSFLLPDIKISTGPWHFRPIKPMRRFPVRWPDWQPIGNVADLFG
jgi:branched-chain amino acid transport system substrate-binding protein